MNVSKSEALFERAQKVIPGGVHSPVRAFRGVGIPPRFIERARGAELTDVDGNTYTDFCMSWGPLILGHADAEVAESVKEALAKGWSFGACEEGSLDLCEFICSELPWVHKLRLVNSGTEAVMSAIRVARAATAKDKIIKFGGCYHGHSDSMLVKAGSGLAEMAVSDSAGVGATTASNTIVAPLNDIEAFRKIISLHGAQTAAVILEPVPANNGLLLQTNDFLKQIVGIARGAGVLIIFDEVITGFRVGFGGMAGVTGLEPDLVTYGKIIGGGFPVGAFGGRQELMDLVAPLGPVYQAGTLSANPVAVAAGLTTLRKLKRENPYQKLADATSTLAEALEKAAQRAGDIPLHVQNVASLFWPVWGELKTSDNVVRTIEQIPSKHSETFRKLYPHLLKEGIYLAPSAFEVGFWSMAHTSDDQEKLTEGLSTAIKNSGAAVGS